MAKIDKPAVGLREALAAPFREDEYEWRVQNELSKGTKVRVLCYVQARAIQNRLDDVMGVFGWKAEYHSGPDGGVVCRLWLKDGEAGEWVFKEDGASNTEIEAVKGGISSALKRAGAVWGIGRLLYSLDAHVVPLKDRGLYFHKLKGTNTYKYWDPPTLPDWAVSKKGTPPGDPPPPDAAKKTIDEKPPIDLDGLKSERGTAYLKKFPDAATAVTKLKETKDVSLEAEAHIQETFERWVQEAVT